MPENVLALGLQGGQVMLVDKTTGEVKWNAQNGEYGEDLRPLSTPKHRPTVRSWGILVSYERGTPVKDVRADDDNAKPLTRVTKKSWPLNAVVFKSHKRSGTHS